ncbi:alpha/beta hydrolase, partial [uncultured Caballeronia sp.]
ARACAAAWGSKWIDAGARGHLNAQSGLGDWADGLKLVEKLQAR